MPKIRTYGEPQVGYQGVNVSSSASLELPGEMGRSLQRFGRQIEDMGDAVYRRQAQSEISDLNAKFAEARADWAQALDEDIRNGTVSAEKAREKYQESISKLSENIETREGREMYERQASGLGAYVTKTAVKGEAQVAGAKAVNDYMSALNTNSNLLQRRPGDFKDVYESSLETIESQVSTGALDASKAEQLRLATGKELSKNAVRGQIRISPSGAKKALDGGQYDQFLDPDTKAQLYNQADAEIKSRQDQFQKTLELKSKDPWKFLQRVGDARGAKPISLGDDAGESFMQRAEFISDMNKKHGVNLPFLSDAEAERVVSTISQRNPEQAVQAFSNVDEKVSDQFKTQFATQVFKKEPSLGAAFMIAGEAPDDARKVVAGMSMLREGGSGTGSAIRPPPTAEVERQFDAYVGSSIEDAGARRAARQAISAHMVKSMFDRGQTNFDAFNQADFDESARAILGPSVEIGGLKTMSFRGKSGQFLDEDQLPDLLDQLTDERVQAVQGDVPRTMKGEPINLAKSRGRLQLKATGDGLYYVFRDGQPAWSQNKRPFELNLKAIEKTAAPARAPVRSYTEGRQGLPK